MIRRHRKYTAEALEPRALLAVSLVKDLNATQSPGSGLWDLEPAGASMVYLSQADASLGRELWRSDGTPDGTVLVKDIRPGSTGSEVGSLTRVGSGSTVFFTADDGSGAGIELWKSDGTAGGTFLVKDINPGPAPSSISTPIDVNGTLFFTADDGGNGAELWKSDGTAAGTVMVKDIAAGVASSSPGFLVNNNGTVFFRANDGSPSGSELWKSNGTAAGTSLVKDISPGSAGSSPSELTVLNGTIYFAAINPASGQELWKSDGSSAGTVMVSDIYSGTLSSAPRGLIRSGSLVYFNVTVTPNHGLWRTDGTAVGTFRIDASPGLAADVNGSLYYTAGSTTIRRTTGSGFSTVTSGMVGMGNFLAVGGTLYFTGDGANGAGYELWKTTGTALSTVMVKDIAAGSASGDPYGLIPFGVGGVFFGATEHATGGALYKSDGTSAGTTLVKDVYDATDDGGPIRVTEYHGALYFNAVDGVSGAVGAGGGELYRTDGTDAGTVLVKDINPGPGGSAIAGLTVFNDRLFFTADTPTHGDELWTSDGTADGTVLLKDLRPGAIGSFADYFVASGNYLYFIADDGSTGQELWRTDGTAAGTIRLTDVTPGAGSSSPDSLTDVNGTLYFTASSFGSQTNGVWKSDGTAAGTVQVNTPNLSDAGELTSFKGTLFFTAFSPSTGYELFKSDGTVPGTAMVKEIRSSGSSSSPDNLRVFGDALYFTANNGTTGVELWKTDGTTAGTVLFKDILQGSTGSNPSALTIANGVLYFRANNGVAGTELWRSDGTTAGTYLLKDINPGTASGASGGAFGLDGFAYFNADDGVHGSEVWRTDGTAEGTVMLADMIPGANTFPGALILGGIGSSVLVSGYGPSVGRELFTADAPVFASLTGGTLQVSGTAHDDVLRVAPAAGGMVEVRLNGLVQIFPAASVAAIQMVAGIGNDRLEWDAAGLAAPVTFTGGSGAETIELLSGETTFTSDLAATTPHLTLEVAGGASATFAATQHLAALHIDANGRAALASGGADKALVVRSVSVAPGGALDLADHAMIVDYAPGAEGSPIGSWDGSAYTGVTGLIAMGREAAAGIFSSTSDGATMLLAVAEAADVLGIAGVDTVTWSGQSVDANSLLVGFTAGGDANLDGVINPDDYALIDFYSHVEGSSGYFNGDFNLDGEINADDYAVIDFNSNA